MEQQEKHSAEQAAAAAAVAAAAAAANTANAATSVKAEPRDSSEADLASQTLLSVTQLPFTPEVGHALLSVYLLFENRSM